MSKQPPRPTFYSLLSETLRTLFTHRRHFLILSILFILPRSSLGRVNHEQFYFDAKSSTAASIILHVIYQTLSFIISVLATGSISFSSYNFLLGRPIKLISSVRSLLRSFPRLLITSSPFLFISGVIMMNDILWNKIDQSSLYLLAIYAMAIWFAVVVVNYLEINWALSSAIVVIESKWGFEPLRRSIQLMQGMRRALMLLMFFNFCISGGFSYLIKQHIGDSKKSNLLFFVLRFVVDTAISMVYNIATTILYCKAAHVDVTRENVSLHLVDDADKT